VTLIFSKTIDERSDENNNGQAVALVNSDVDGLRFMFEMLHEMWAQTLEVFIGIFILMTVVGWLWLIPIFMVFGRFYFLIFFFFFARVTCKLRGGIKH